jgi:DNA polymerase-3 subunit gamma/tau
VGLQSASDASQRLDTDFSDWHGFVNRLGLNGMAAQLANNCVFHAWDGKQLSLRLDPVCQGLIGSLAEQRLQEAVSAAAGRSVSLHLAAEAGGGETPAQREARETRARQEATEADISGDPLVVAVQETFDGEIVPDSIRRID